MRQILTIVACLLSLTIVGAVGFRLLTTYDWVDCFYLAVVTLTTVGSAQPDPLTDGVKIFIIGYLISGLGLFTYSGFSLGQAIISAQIQSAIERRRIMREKAVESLRDHFIVCGQGRMGTTICEYLDQRGQEFVVIDVNEEQLAATCEQKKWMHVVGDATDDAVLLKAGIERARSLASVLPTDADNVYVVLSARMLASDMQIIARASDEKAVDKMQRAGATRIVSPFSSGAVKMARFMLTPSIEDFLEVADMQGNDLEVADVIISEDSPYVGKQLKETDLRDKGIMVIGIRRANGERLMPPPSTAVIQIGDALFAFGSADSVNEMIDNTSRTN